ncbi:MAG TPA: TetR/AcrR family transcriptional regulator [Candidatus Binatia bacterium]|nr:TetR/AcrR family transcriptional regulator [Candidatus Binatia bacterium]
MSAIKDPHLVRDRRRRLVRAAMAVFVRKGYHRATVRDIGREGGFTQGTIYNYVRSKADILYLVCEEVVAAYHEAVRRAIGGIEDPRRRLQAALRAVVEVMQDRQDQILLLYHESHALDRAALRAILSRVEEFIRTFEAMVAAARPAGVVTPRRLRLVANIVTFLPTMVALRRWDLDRRLPRSEVAAGLTEFMMRGLGLTDGRLAAARTDGAAGGDRVRPRRRDRGGEP